MTVARTYEEITREMEEVLIPVRQAEAVLKNLRKVYSRQLKILKSAERKVELANLQAYDRIIKLDKERKKVSRG